MSSQPVASPPLAWRVSDLDIESPCACRRGGVRYPTHATDAVRSPGSIWSCIVSSSVVARAQSTMFRLSYPFPARERDDVGSVEVADRNRRERGASPVREWPAPASAGGVSASAIAMFSNPATRARGVPRSVTASDPSAALNPRESEGGFPPPPTPHAPPRAACAAISDSPRHGRCKPHRRGCRYHRGGGVNERVLLPIVEGGPPRRDRGRLRLAEDLCKRGPRAEHRGQARAVGAGDRVQRLRGGHASGEHGEPLVCVEPGGCDGAAECGGGVLRRPVERGPRVVEDRPGFAPRFQTAQRLPIRRGKARRHGRSVIQGVSAVPQIDGVSGAGTGGLQRRNELLQRRLSDAKG